MTRGRVRVVRETHREWNYREQKWDIDEGDKYEGETDAKGLFVARIKLAEDHEHVSDYYYRFKDVTYAAYFTDPTTNRTEQRRFDLRITKEAIHVYVLRDDYDWKFNPTLPLRFSVSTFYADGSPARCRVHVKVTDSGEESINRSLPPVRTNPYGVAKFSGVRLPLGFADVSRIDLVVSAVNSRGAKGSRTEDDISLDRKRKIIVETDKALYRSGEPITAVITSSVPDDTVVVDIAQDWSLVHSERVKLRNGRASDTFPYRPAFKNQLTIDLDSFRDPWGTPYRPVFSVDRQFDTMNLESAGADKRFDTDDDLFVGQQGWPYFRPIGEAIDKAVREYHTRTGGYIRDFTTLSSEVSSALLSPLGGNRSNASCSMIRASFT